MSRIQPWPKLNLISLGIDQNFNKVVIKELFEQLDNIL